MVFFGSSAVAAPLGASLREALRELTRAGLQLVFSDALVTDDMRVVADGGGTLEERAARLLAPHGLQLEPVRPGVFVVVRREPQGGARSRLEIEVLLPDGRPAIDAQVTIAPTRRVARSDAQGIAAFVDLPPGRYDIEAVATPHDAGSGGLRNIELRPGDTLRSVVRLSLPLEEISVVASRYTLDLQSDLALTQLGREDLQLLPNFDEDALRVTRYLPGTATNGISARAHVRGGRENELAVYFDGAPLYEPFHFKD
ncbi:MAG: carboxypeptidase-like regulatory domain-containing protein, partial [Gammaproteobacteria bacterium]|nr:carboxypeptidase-like regulatory domain-containing protein [Gammaproteobacteria bacterium]